MKIVGAADHPSPVTPSRRPNDKTRGIMTFPNFHDGFLDGFLIRQRRSIDLYLRTPEGKCYTLACHGVESLNISGVREGNIILDVTFLRADQLTHSDVDRLQDLSPVDPVAQRIRFLQVARERALQAVVVTASYGAECWLLCEGWTLNGRHGDEATFQDGPS